MSLLKSLKRWDNRCNAHCLLPLGHPRGSVWPCLPCLLRGRPCCSASATLHPAPHVVGWPYHASVFFLASAPRSSSLPASGCMLLWYCPPWCWQARELAHVAGHWSTLTPPYRVPPSPGGDGLSPLCVYSCCPPTPCLPSSNHSAVLLSIILSFQIYHISGIIQLATFRIGTFSPSIILWKFIQVIASISYPSFILLHSIPWYACSFIHWRTSGLFLVFDYYE